MADFSDFSKSLVGGTPAPLPISKKGVGGTSVVQEKQYGPPVSLKTEPIIPPDPNLPNTPENAPEVNKKYVVQGDTPSKASLRILNSQIDQLKKEIPNESDSSKRSQLYNLLAERDKFREGTQKVKSDKVSKEAFVEGKRNYHVEGFGSNLTQGVSDAKEWVESKTGMDLVSKEMAGFILRLNNLQDKYPNIFKNMESYKDAPSMADIPRILKEQGIKLDPLEKEIFYTIIDQYTNPLDQALWGGVGNLMTKGVQVAAPPVTKALVKGFEKIGGPAAIKYVLSKLENTFPNFYRIGENKVAPAIQKAADWAYDNLIQKRAPKIEEEVRGVKPLRSGEPDVLPPDSEVLPQSFGSVKANPNEFDNLANTRQYPPKKESIPIKTKKTSGAKEPKEPVWNPVTKQFEISKGNFFSGEKLDMNEVAGRKKWREAKAKGKKEAAEKASSAREAKSETVGGKKMPFDKIFRKSNSSSPGQHIPGEPLKERVMQDELQKAADYLKSDHGMTDDQVYEYLNQFRKDDRERIMELFSGVPNFGK